MAILIEIEVAPRLGKREETTRMLVNVANALAIEECQSGLVEFSLPGRTVYAKNTNYAEIKAKIACAMQNGGM